MCVSLFFTDALRNIPFPACFRFCHNYAGFGRKDEAAPHHDHNDMINILHTIDTTGPGGAETVFIDLASRLARARYTPTVAITGPGWVADELRRRGFDPVMLATQASFDANYVRQLLRIIRRHRIDIVQSHLFGSNIYCSAAGFLSRTPVVSVFHGAVDVAKRERFVKAKFGVVNGGSAAVVCVSDHLRQSLLQTTNLSARKAVTIYNGIDTRRFFPRRDTGVRAALGIADDDIVVGTIGNVRRPKAYDVLLRAARWLADRSPKFKFIVAGAGGNRLHEELLALRAQLKLEDRVFFIGFRADAEVVLNNCDVFALSSSSEGFSIATLEAMACGVPVAVTRSGGPEEIVTHEANGLLVPTQAPDALAQAIERLAGDAALRARLIAAAHRLVESKFTLDAMVAQYEQIYARVLRRA